MSRLPVLVNFVSDRLSRLPVAFVHVTERCNSRCIGCDFWRHGHDDLPVERALSLSRELDALGTELVVLSGGEPLFHPRWRAVADALRTPERSLWLLTSGLSLAGEASEVARVVERVTVSLDGATASSYRRVRGVDAFDRVLSGIEALVSRKSWVSLRTTVQKANFREMPELVQLARELGVRQISFFPADVRSPHAFARVGTVSASRIALDRQDLDDLETTLTELEASFPTEMESGFIAENGTKLRHIHQYFAALAGLAPFPEVICNAPRFSAVVRTGGRLQPCHFIEGARAASIEDALATTRRLRREIRSGLREECERCVCPMWKRPLDLLRGAHA